MMFRTGGENRKGIVMRFGYLVAEGKRSGSLPCEWMNKQSLKSPSALSRRGLWQVGRLVFWAVWVFFCSLNLLLRGKPPSADCNSTSLSFHLVLSSEVWQEEPCVIRSMRLVHLSVFCCPSCPEVSVSEGHFTFLAGKSSWVSQLRVYMPKHFRVEITTQASSSDQWKYTKPDWISPGFLNTHFHIIKSCCLLSCAERFWTHRPLFCKTLHEQNLS